MQLKPSAGANGPRLVVVDGSPVDDPHFGYLARVAEGLPLPAKVGGFRELPALVGEVAEEVNRRQAANDFEAPPIFLFIYGLQRLRDLRRQEDDFGFGRDDKPVSPAQQFGTIIKEGPGVGVYTVVWCDSLNNVNRALDRQGLREFEMKVLFQMSVTDSSVLIDSPAASKLGMHHALFYMEERGHPEKFRPYGLPAPEWLAEVKEQLAR